MRSRSRPTGGGPEMPLRSRLLASHASSNGTGCAGRAPPRHWGPKNDGTRSTWVSSVDLGALADVAAGLAPRRADHPGPRRDRRVVGLELALDPPPELLGTGGQRPAGQDPERIPVEVRLGVRIDEVDLGRERRVAGIEHADLDERDRIDCELELEHAREQHPAAALVHVIEVDQQRDPRGADRLAHPHPLVVDQWLGQARHVDLLRARHADLEVALRVVVGIEQLGLAVDPVLVVAGGAANDAHVRVERAHG